MSLAWLAFVINLLVMLLSYRSEHHAGTVIEGGRIVQIAYYGTFAITWLAAGFLFSTRSKAILNPFILASCCLVGLMLLNLFLSAGLRMFIARYHLTWLGFLVFAFLFALQHPQKLEKVSYFMGVIMIPVAVVVILRQRGAVVVSEGMTLNEVYWLLPLLPWCFITPRKSIQLFGVLIAAVVTVWSAKRGALFALGAMLLAMYVTVAILRRKRSDFLLRWLQATAIVLLAGLSLLYFDNMRGGILLQRVNNILADGGSGRFAIYLIAWESIRSFSFMELLFGQGYYSVRRLYGFTQAGVHNDWLQMFHDMGLTGLAAYIGFQGIIIWQFIDTVRRRNWIAVPLIGLYVYFFCLSIYSIGIFSPRFFMTAIAFGAFLGMAEARRSLVRRYALHQNPSVRMAPHRIASQPAYGSDAFRKSKSAIAVVFK
jgi:hypothetical protein